VKIAVGTSFDTEAWGGEGSVGEFSFCALVAFLLAVQEAIAIKRAAERGITIISFKIALVLNFLFVIMITRFKLIWDYLS